jgi:hypothetical protein
MEAAAGHPCKFDAVTVYWVVMTGEAIGLATAGLERPVEGVHAYVLAPEAWRFTVCPEHIV